MNTNYLLPDLETYLVAQGITTDICLGGLEATPDEAIGIQEYGGQAPDILSEIDNPAVQVVVRSASYATGRGLIETIKGKLHRLVNIQLTHVYVIQCFANSGIIPLGRDADERMEFAINFYLKVR